MWVENAQVTVLFNMHVKHHKVLIYNSHLACDMSLSFNLWITLLGRLPAVTLTTSVRKLISKNKNHSFFIELEARILSHKIKF